MREMGRYLASAIVAWSYLEKPTIDTLAGVINENGDREGGIDDKMGGWLILEVGKLATGDRSDPALLANSSPSTSG